MATYRTDDDHPRSGAGRALWIILLVLIVLGLIAWAMGLLNFDASGELKAPDVKVEGGQVPDVQVETGDIDVGTKKVEVPVPDVDVKPAGDDGSANR